LYYADEQRVLSAIARLQAAGGGSINARRAGLWLSNTLARVLPSLQLASRRRAPDWRATAIAGRACRFLYRWRWRRNRWAGRRVAAIEISERFAPVAAKGARRDLNSWRGLPPLIFAVVYHRHNPADGRFLEA
jgi:hypothetical protein